MMKNYILLVLTLIALNKLFAKVGGGDPPVANYSYYIEYVGFGSEVYLLNESIDGITYSWDFGDGAASTDVSPVHAYPEPGIFIICLTATNDFGSDTYCDTLNTFYPPSADFSFTGDPTVTFTDMTVNFPDSWDWFFGDGDISNIQNPEHTFLTNGDFNVCLSAGNPGGTSYVCKTVSISSYAITEAAFSYSGDPFVSFIDLSSLDPFAWEWSFGDGGTSNFQHPFHTYAEEDIYTVCITATNAGGSNTYCEDITITDAIAEPEADFSYLILDLGIAFVDESANDPFEWNWDFGDGNTSTEQNPANVYDESGNYEICLIATNAGGYDVACKTVFLETTISDLYRISYILYPNPVTETVNIQLQKTISNGAIKIYNAMGNIVSQSNMVHNNIVHIATSALPSGNYFFLIEKNEDRVCFGEFLKM